MQYCAMDDQFFQAAITEENNDILREYRNLEYLVERISKEDALEEEAKLYIKAFNRYTNENFEYNEVHDPESVVITELSFGFVSVSFAEFAHQGMINAILVYASMIHE